MIIWASYIQPKLAQDLFKYNFITDNFLIKLGNGDFSFTSEWSFEKDSIEDFHYLVAAYHNNDDYKYIVGDEKMVCFYFEKHNQNCILFYLAQKYEIKLDDNRIKKLTIFTRNETINVKVIYKSNELFRIKNKVKIENQGMPYEYVFNLVKEFNAMLLILGAGGSGPN